MNTLDWDYINECRDINDDSLEWRRSGIDIVKICMHVNRKPNLLKLIAEKEEELFAIGFISMNALTWTANVVALHYKSILSSALNALVWISYDVVEIRVDGYPMNDFGANFPEYMAQLAAAKNHRAAVISAVVGLLPQPIAEEVAPEISLSKMHS